MADSKILNPEQTKAIEHGDGPLLIIAGAGSGKTTVVTERIKYLITQKNVQPSEILALTFTDKSAREMEERVDIAMPYGYTQMWIATFHGFCDRILRNESLHIGLNPSYTLMTEAETIMFLRNHVFAFDLKYFRPLGNPHKFLEGMLQHFSRLRDEDITPEEYIRYAEQMANGKWQMEDKNNKKLNSRRYKDAETNADEAEVEKTMELAIAFKTYQDLKDKEGVMDYSDLISNTLRLFRQRKNILKQYQNQFKYILVDEFQDTNFAQNQLAILLAGERENITVVGDDDQAIYRWRGAAISNMIQFRKQFPKTAVISLTKNYRSSQEILDKSHTLISFNNPDRLEVKENINKHLVAMRKTKNYPIELLYEERVEDEADCTIKTIQELIKKEKREYKDFAILVRANDHAQAFVKALQRNNIPFQFLGPGRLFRQEEIKDLIAYLKVLYNFEDSTSLYRVLSIPILDIEARDIAALLNFGKRKNLTLFEALERITTPQQELLLKETATQKLTTVAEMIQRHLKLVPTLSAGQILYYFLDDTGLLKKFMDAKTEIETKRYQNIAKFFDKLKSYEAEHEDARVFPVVDWIDLSMQMGESPLAADMDWSDNNAVNVLTIHSSKGLEFPVVFLVNLVSQRFPTRERREQIPIPQDIIKEILPEGDYHLQEERRLFYVGMTRARDRLYFTAAKYYGEGKRDRKISPFVYETFGQEVVEKLIVKQKAEKAVVQPSLLDWADHFQENKQPPATTQQNTAVTYLSFSQLQTYEMCPLHYKLQYILRIPGQPIAPLSFGNSVHSALRDFYQKWLQDKTTKSEEIIQMLEHRWIDEGYQSKAHQQAAKERAKFVLQTYLQKNFRPENKEIIPLGVEIPFQFFLQDSTDFPAGVKIGGRIDRVDKLDGNTIEIIDYKTGSNMPTQRELATNLQLTIYALAATKVHDKIFNKQPDEVILSLVYLEEEKKLATTRTKEQLEQATEQIFAKIKEIQTSEFFCSGSIMCQNCEYKMLCSTL